MPGLHFPRADVPVPEMRRRVALTLREPWGVVVDVRDDDGHGGGSRQAAQLPCHVRGADHHLVPVLRLAVQVGHRRADHACRGRGAALSPAGTLGAQVSCGGICRMSSQGLKHFVVKMLLRHPLPGAGRGMGRNAVSGDISSMEGAGDAVRRCQTLPTSPAGSNYRSDYRRQDLW